LSITKSLETELPGEAGYSPQGRIELMLVSYRRIQPDPGCVSFRTGEQIALIVVESVSVFPAVAEDAGVQLDHLVHGWDQVQSLSVLLAEIRHRFRAVFRGKFLQ
jgi:hypothetical protein